MFIFQTIGRINGMNPSKDSRLVYLKVVADHQPGVDLQPNEAPDALNIACPADGLPQGATIGTRVAIEGTGAHAAHDWVNPRTQKAQPITNLRLQARSVKLAK
jgi:hypothetical protein